MINPRKDTTSNSVLPKVLKYGKILKKEDPSQVKSYRPVSVP